jgi:hypothetical protein
MSSTSEPSDTGNPLDALEALYAAQRRPSERPEPPRLAAINELAALARAPRPEPVRPIAVPPLGERIESILPESARRRIAPEVVPEPADFRSEGRRRKMVAAVIGVAAAVAIAAVVTMLLVNVFPRDNDAADPSVTAATASQQSVQTEQAAPKPVSQAQAPAATSDGDQNLDHEQSEQLLQQFMQWQQKAASSDKP